MIEIQTIKQKTTALRRKLSGKKMSIQQFLQIEHTDISGLISKELAESLGAIEYGFDIFLFGNSGDGKSSFANILVKEFAQFGKVLHVVYEEGHSKSVRMNLSRSGIAKMALNGQLPNGYEILDNCPYDDLVYLLGKKQSAKVIIIDSFQYSRFTKEQWLALKAKYVKGKKSQKKIFIVISHAEGRGPRGAVATDCMFDAQIKVFVKGKIAFIKSRYEGKKNYVIWDEGAKAFWGKRYKTMLTKQIF